MVLDVHLPDINGFTCLRELRRRCPGDRPAVLLFSADLDVEEQSDDARTLGAAVVSKLCDLEELERVIASLCVMLTH